MSSCGLPLKFCTGRNNRLVCSFEPSTKTRLLGKRHGPALSTEKVASFAATDTVLALQCRSWPVCASEWLIRYRPFNFPSSDQIDICKAMGCLFVPVGHPDSDEQDLLSRVSFSHQERSFVTDFNSVQLKCYTFLKMIKKNELIVTKIPDSLSSYHLKTCMLYNIEKIQVILETQ